MRLRCIDIDHLVAAAGPSCRIPTSSGLDFHRPHCSCLALCVPVSLVDEARASSERLNAQGKVQCSLLQTLRAGRQPSCGLVWIDVAVV